MMSYTHKEHPPMPAAQVDMDEYPDTSWSGHRRPSEAGSADRYYGRRCVPNFDYMGYRYSESEMTPAQILEYKKAWFSEQDRKEFV